MCVVLAPVSIHLITLPYIFIQYVTQTSSLFDSNKQLSSFHSPRSNLTGSLTNKLCPSSKSHRTDRFPHCSLLQDAESKSETSQAISAREHFVFTDTDGQVYHITVEGNTVKDGARIPPDVSNFIFISISTSRSPAPSSLRAPPIVEIRSVHKDPDLPSSCLAFGHQYISCLHLSLSAFFSL